MSELTSVRDNFYAENPELRKAENDWLVMLRYCQSSQVKDEAIVKYLKSRQGEKLRRQILARECEQQTKKETELTIWALFWYEKNINPTSHGKHLQNLLSRLAGYTSK